MADRNLKEVRSLDYGVVQLFCVADIGATGAPTLDTTRSVGIASIARTAAGDYTITLTDKYYALLSAHAIQQEADDEDLQIQIAAEDVDGAKTVQLICTAAATPTDPSSGSKLRVALFLKNSSVGG